MNWLEKGCNWEVAMASEATLHANLGRRGSPAGAQKNYATLIHLSSKSDDLPPNNTQTWGKRTLK